MPGISFAAGNEAVDRASAACGLAAIVLITVAVVVPNVGGGGDASARDVARAEANAIGVALRAASADCGAVTPPDGSAPRWLFGPGVLPRGNPFARGDAFPITGVLCSNALAASAWRGPYLGRVPIDPWGRAYLAGLDAGGRGAVAVLSAGPDGIVDTRPGDASLSGDDVGIVLAP